MENIKDLKIKEIFKDAFVLYRSNIPIFLIISFLTNITLLIDITVAYTRISLGWFGFIILIARIVLPYWGIIALISAVSARYLNKATSIKEAYLCAKGKFLRFICVTVLCALISVLGYLFLLIPGIYLSIIFSLAGIVLVLEDRGLFDSLRRSKGLIKGYFWRILLLYLAVFVIFAPTNLILLIKAGIVPKIFLLSLIAILVMPFTLAVNINLYYRLLKIKNAGGPVQTQGNKKGEGCLWCLGVIGLIIAITVLSSFWMRNLFNFFKSERGNKYYEWIAEKVSPNIVFPGEASLERPEGYLALKSDYQILKYSLYGAKKNRSFKFEAFAIPLKDLGIEDKTSIRLDDGLIWDKYFDYLIKRLPAIERYYSSMEKQPIKLLEIGGKTWVEYKLKRKEPARSRYGNVWVFTYTLSNNSVIFFSYAHEDSEGENGPVAEAQEIQKILEKMNFQ